MADLQQSFRNIAATPALTAGSSPDHSEHLYLIDQFEEEAAEEMTGLILWGDVFVDTRHPQRLC